MVVPYRAYTVGAQLIRYATGQMHECVFNWNPSPANQVRFILILSNQMQNAKHGKLAVQIYTLATMMWLAAHSAEFIVSSKDQLNGDPEAFWPEEEGEAIGGNWASYPGYGDMFFEGDEEAAYLDPEHLHQIEVVVTERGIEFTAPEEVDEALRSHIVAACKP
jgi:hypothetical protein